MITAQVDTSGLTRGMNGLIQKLGLNAKVVVAKETGELIKTLVRTSPPDSRQKTGKNIERDVNAKFNEAGDSNRSNLTGITGEVGPAGILWYMVTPKFLFGVAPQSDKRDASAEDLERLRWRITKSGNQNLPFRHPRDQQRVHLSQTLLTKRSTVRKIITKAKSHVGRLKAAWLVATARGPIRLTGSNMPPEWVKRHAAGAKGTFVDGLSTRNKPTFTIINMAKGIGQKKVNFLVQSAVNIRAKAMQMNIALFIRGKKKLSDYSRN